MCLFLRGQFNRHIQVPAWGQPLGGIVSFTPVTPLLLLALTFCSTNGTNNTYGTGNDMRWCSAGLMHPATFVDCAERTTWGKAGDTFKSEALYRVFVLLMHFLLFHPQLFCLLHPDRCHLLPLFFTGFLSSVSSCLSQTGHKPNKVWSYDELLNCVMLDQSGDQVKGIYAPILHGEMRPLFLVCYS